MAHAALKQQATSSPEAGIRERLGALDDSDLMRAYLGGEERAFQELVERYQTRLLNFLYRTIGDRERAEDLLQEAFIRAYRHAHRFDQSRNFSAWIYTIASNLAKNELRNRARRALVFQAAPRDGGAGGDGTPQVEDPRSRPDDLFDKRSLQALVKASIERLPEHHRQVFVLRELEGKSYDEIAEITRCNLGTVKSRLSRARSSFAAIIEPALHFGHDHSRRPRGGACDD